MASLKNYFSCVSVENYVAALFKPTSPERGKETVKRPVGRPRKRPLESDGQALPDNRELENIQAAPVHGEEPSVKSIRRQYTEKQKKHVVLYTRHHGVRPTERKFSIPRRNIQRWLNSFCDSDFEQSITKRGPKKQELCEAGKKLAGN